MCILSQSVGRWSPASSRRRRHCFHFKQLVCPSQRRASGSKQASELVGARGVASWPRALRSLGRRRGRTERTSVTLFSCKL